MRPRLLDLFGCAGIGADGYAAAGFEVTSVDVDRAALRHNPHNPIQRDALEALQDDAFLAGFDAIHASPPCQAYSVTRHTHDAEHPDLLGPVLELLRAQSLPWIVENVPGAPMPGALVLCGSEFGLRAWDERSKRTVALKRHRLFLSSVDLWGAGGCMCAADRHAQRIAGVYGGATRDHVTARTVRGGGYAVTDKHTAARLLGLERDEPPPIRYQQQCIPPAYTRFLGEQLLEHVAVAV
jgi:DNA (cytosine-5)-methyltransferase 1